MIKLVPKGFIALTSALLISAVLVVLMFATSSGALYARYDAMGTQFKRASLSLVEGCTNHVLLKLAQDYSYSGNESFLLGSDMCKVDTIAAAVVAPDTNTAKRKKVTITTSAQYPSVYGSWTTNQITAVVVNPSIRLITIPPVCNSFTLSAASNPLPSGQSVSLGWNATNGSSFEVKKITSAGAVSLGADLPLIGALSDSPTESTTYVGIATGDGGTQTQCDAVSIAVKPSVGECADTVVMLDRTGSLFDTPSDPIKEGVAVKQLFSLYDHVSSALIGVGSFGGLDGSTASVPLTTGNGWSGYLSTEHGVATSSASVGPTAPESTISPNQWGTAGNVLLTDGLFTTSSSNTQQQGYKGFGFSSIPSTATIDGIELTIDAESSGTSVSPTGTLTPSGQGSYSSWGGGVDDIDETGSPDCSSSDSLVESSVNLRESVNLSLNGSVPLGATILSLQVTVYDRGNTSSGGTYKTFARIGGTNTDATSTLTAGSASGNCGAAKTQYVDVPDTTRGVSTDLEIGVVKASGNNNSVRVGAIRAVVTYMVAGTLSVILSTNNGLSWGGTTHTTDGIGNVVSSYKLGGPGDLWGHVWKVSEVTQLGARIQNNSTGGTMSVDSITAKIYYTATSTNLYNVVDQMIARSSRGVGSQLDTAIQQANAELNSIRHVQNATTGKYPKKVLILISDGVPTSPSSNQKTLDAARVATTTLGVDGATTTIFTIAYGSNSSGQKLMKALASAAGNAFVSPTFDQMSSIFDTIGNAVCPAATAPTAPLPNPPPPPPPVPPANISIGSWQEIIDIGP